MSIIAWLVIGLLAGWIASMIMRSGYGLIGDLVLGVVGAIVGGWLAGIFLHADYTTGINIETLITAVVGAIVVIAIARLVTGRRVTG
ncbi:MAG: GlsB/YeaQ/YmgE family stress response membrane protein [Anaerolineae bacterium]